MYSAVSMGTVDEFVAHVYSVNMTTNQRDKILGCACDLFLEEGLDGFSMRKLARSVGVTAPALYRHYESRERVLQDVVGEAFKVFGQYLYRALEEATPWARLRRTGEEYANFAVEHPRLYRVIHVSPEMVGADWSSTQEAAQACATGNFLVDRVRECMDAGLLREEDPGEVAVTIWAHSHGLASLYLRGLLGVEAEQFRTLFRESGARLMRGLGTEAVMDEQQDPEAA